MNSPIRSIRGMNDILPQDIHYWKLLERKAEQVFSSFGFEQIRIPLLEKTEVFTRRCIDDDFKKYSESKARDKECDTWISSASGEKKEEGF